MESSQVKQHKMTIINRKSLLLTGITDAVSFDTETVLLESTQGMILIKGKNLKVGKIQLESGEVDVEGTVDSFQYTEAKDYAKKGQTLLKRMFR